MSKRVLMAATVPSMIGQFNRENIRILQKMNYDVHLAANFTENGAWTKEITDGFVKDMEAEGIPCHQIDFSRSATDIASHINSFKQIKSLISKYGFCFIHTHTPTASAIIRTAARKTGIKVIYTAHGFHFYKGAPLKNWILFYPVERILSKYTDILVTINLEDFRIAKNRFKAKKTEYIPGVGINTSRFLSSARTNTEADTETKYRKKMGLSEDDILVVSVGELNYNKNHSIIIRALSKTGDNVHYAIAGKGELHDTLLSLAKQMGVENRVHLLGYLEDIPELFSTADIFAFPSIREGQGLAAIEAMASGLPLVVSDNRGLRDILTDDNAITCKHDDADAFAAAIKRLVDDTEKRAEMGLANLEKSKEFDKSVVNRKMEEIYCSMA